MQEPLFSEGDLIDDALVELQKTPGWPFDPAKDRILLVDLRDSFPQMDLIEEIRAWRAWMLGHETTKKVNRRARLRRWFTNGAGYRRNGGQPRGSSPQAGGYGPEPSSVFGDKVVRLDDW